MEYKSKTQKLSELRAKTDRELTTLILSLMERGRIEDAMRLLPMVGSAQRRLLEQKLSQAPELSAGKSVYAA